MACVIEGMTLTPAAIRTDRRRGYLVAINNCVRSVELALQTCRAAAFPCEYVEGLLGEARELMDQAVQLGHPTEWTRNEDLEALRLMGDASTLATRAVGQVWIGCGAGGAAAIEANDPSAAHAAAEEALADVREGSLLRAIEPASQRARSPSRSPSRSLRDRQAHPPWRRYEPTRASSWGPWEHLRWEHYRHYQQAHPPWRRWEPPRASSWGPWEHLRWEEHSW